MAYFLSLTALNKIEEIFFKFSERMYKSSRFFGDWTKRRCIPEALSRDQNNRYFRLHLGEKFFAAYCQFCLW